jgi:tetratricopeptide (TPR) repeat protein
MLARLSWFYHQVGQVEKAVAAGDQAVTTLRRYTIWEDLLSALYSYQVAVLMVPLVEIGTQFVQEGLNLARSLGDTYWEGHFLVRYAITDSVIHNDMAAAQLHSKEALAIFESVGDRWGSMLCYDLLGRIEEAQKNYAQAAVYLQHSISLSETFGHNVNGSASITHLARIAFANGDIMLARRYLREALRIVSDTGYLWFSAFPRAVASQMLAEQNDASRAVEILGAIEKYLTPFHQADQVARNLRDELASKLPAHEFADAWAHGQGRELGDLIQELVLEFAEPAASGVPPTLTHETGPLAGLVDDGS